MAEATDPSSSFAFIPGLWTLCYHWAGRFHRRFFASEEAARAHMEKHEFLTRTVAPRASRVLCSPARVAIELHAANSEWQHRINDELRACLFAVDTELGAFQVDASLPLSTGKLTSTVLPVYSRFEGSTVVMAIAAAQLCRWQLLHDQLASDLAVTSGLVLLPSSSYHITLRGIATVPELKSGVAYNQYILNRFGAMLMLDQSFADDASNSQSSIPIHFHPVSVRHSIAVAAADAATEQWLRLAEARAVAALGLKAHPAQRWHMSLAYPRPDATAEQWSAAGVRTAQLVAAFFADHAADGVTAAQLLECERPRVCSFYDMTLFTPIRNAVFGPAQDADE